MFTQPISKLNHKQSKIQNPKSKIEMAVLQKFWQFFAPVETAASDEIVPAPPTEYSIHPLTGKQSKELLRLSLRCFKSGENYTKFTFDYLLDAPNSLSYRIVAANGDMTGFIFVTMVENGTGHITTVGVAPEHRRRGLGAKMLDTVETALRTRQINTVFLEVRVSNQSAQNLYHRRGYAITQRIQKYYNNGEDGFVMVKSLF